MTVYQRSSTTVGGVVSNVVNLVTSTGTSATSTKSASTSTSAASPATTTIPVADDDQYELVCTRVKKSTLRR